MKRSLLVLPILVSGFVLGLIGENYYLSAGCVLVFLADLSFQKWMREEDK